MIRDVIQALGIGIIEELWDDLIAMLKSTLRSIASLKEIAPGL